MKSGFCYVMDGKHVYVEIHPTNQGYYVEIQGVQSRIVPDIKEINQHGDYLYWTLVKEVEKEILQYEK